VIAEQRARLGVAGVDQCIDVGGRKRAFGGHVASLSGNRGHSPISLNAERK
jgi:hypothetical protein